MPNPEILNVEKACEIETHITLSTIQNQEEQESELLREETEIFEASVPCNRSLFKGRCLVST
jgi:hypothetical protein